jgi:hypothetical protein
MTFALSFTEVAKQELKGLKNSPHLEKRYKAVVKALGFLSQNPRHPGLQTHKYTSLRGPEGEEVFEAYAEQNTPGAWRIFFFYGPGKREITVEAIVPHP